MLKIGPYRLPNRLMLAPMAGVSDLPFRRLCKHLGAGYAVAEMQSAQPGLRRSRKSRQRADRTNESSPLAVQLLGTDPVMMAEAAGYNIEQGAQIIDINMGCPAKKVCSTWAGSALMRNEPLALEIAEAVVKAALPHGVPVTLKMRTGWSASTKNALSLAQRFEDIGIQMLTIHGRTRDQAFRGAAEYETIAEIKARVKIPVVANGDIDSPHKAAKVLAATGADALMIGRAARGQPWLFRTLEQYLSGKMPEPLRVAEVRHWLLRHLDDHYAFYGDLVGARSARKHIGWYLQRLPGDIGQRRGLRQAINGMETPGEQVAALNGYFDGLEGLVVGAGN